MCVDLVVVSNKGREGTFAVSLQYRKRRACIHKIFKNGSTTEVVCREFYILILDVKCT